MNPFANYVDLFVGRDIKSIFCGEPVPTSPENALAPVRRHGDGSAVAPPLRGAIVQPPLLEKRIDKPYPDADDESDERGNDDVGGSAVAFILVVIVAWSVLRHARGLRDDR